jgi:putative ABC transport system permease protein
METLVQDLRYGARMLMKNPGFSLIAVLALALGIGANTAMFSVINAAVLAPFPVKDARSLVSLFTTDAKNPGALPNSHLNFQDYRDKTDVFSGVLGYTFAPVSLSGGSGESKQLFAEVVSGNYFDVLGVKTAYGRTFLPDEDKTPGASPVVVLSYAAWQRNFGGDPGLVGRTISLNRHDFTVVGVAEEEFTGTDIGFIPDLWVPMMMHAQIQPGFTWYDTRRGLFISVIGRLKPGVALPQAQAELTTLGQQLEREYPNDNQGRNAKMVPLLQARIDPTGDGQLLLTSGLMVGVVGLVLLIACANVANLLLARATRRQREIAIRLAIGASRRRLVRQLMTESLVLSLAGGVAGILIAYWSRDLIRSFGPFGGVGPNSPSPNLDARVLVFTFAISLLSGALFGLIPAIQASRPDLVPTLKGEVTVPVNRRGLRISLRKALVVLQVSLSLFALITAGLFVRSLQKAQAIDPGFQAENVILMGFDLGREGYGEPQGKELQRDLIERVQALPGVRSATIARDRPFGGGLLRSVFIEGQEPTPDGRGVLVQTNVVGRRFFETLGIPVLRGRDFAESDGETAPAVVIINESMATRFWPSGDAIGKRFKFFGDQNFREVVGIARDSKYNSLTERNQPFVYMPLLQNYTPLNNLHVRTSIDPAGVMASVRSEIQKIDPNLTLQNVQTLSERVDGSLGGERAQATMLGVFGLMALLLAAVGLYGVMAYSVAQRTREIGIRMALGARKGDVLSLVLRQGVTLVSIGVAVGLVVAFATTRLLASLLFGIGAADPITFAATSLILIAVALIATYVPARRAATVDPIRALRYE